MESSNSLVDIAGRVLIKLFIVAEDYDGNIDRAKNGELVSLLEQATFALEESTVRLSQPPTCIAYSVSNPKGLPVLQARMVYVLRVLGTNRRLTRSGSYHP